MAETKLTVNGTQRVVDADPRTPLLWVLRDHLDLTGTKYGCGIGQCGACAVILEGNAVRSCQVLLSRAEGKRITTIEGLSSNRNHPAQRAWLSEQVPQCGYCQSGQIMATAVLLSSNLDPSDSEIDDALSGNICRCGTYHRIRRAVHLAAELARKEAKKS
jgi:isoquinoline 1-oxidoreductase alpha subunit